MGLFELAAFLLGVDVRKHMERDLVVGNEAGEEDLDLKLNDEPDEALAEPQLHEPAEVPTVLSQESQDRIKDLLRQLERGHRR